MWVDRLADGSYRFLAEDDYEHLDERYTSISNTINNTQRVVSAQTPPRNVPVDFWYIERQLFIQFPETFVFTDKFSLHEDLPRALDEDHIAGNQNNSLTDAFGSRLARHGKARTRTQIGEIWAQTLLFGLMIV